MSIVKLNSVHLKAHRDMRNCSWFRHCATSKKVVGLICNVTTGFFICPNLSSRTTATNINGYQESPWALKDGRCIKLTPSLPSVS
jgi:hypothetical protein